MRHGGVFTCRMNKDGLLRIPHGLGVIPAYWSFRPAVEGFNLGPSQATREEIVIYVQGCGPFRRNFPIEWDASSLTT